MPYELGRERCRATDAEPNATKIILLDDRMLNIANRQLTLAPRRSDQGVPCKEERSWVEQHYSPRISQFAHRRPGSQEHSQKMCYLVSHDAIKKAGKVEFRDDDQSHLHATLLECPTRNHADLTDCLENWFMKLETIMSRKLKSREIERSIRSPRVHIYLLRS